MAQMSIKRQMQAIGYFKKVHSQLVALSSVKYHTLIITNLCSCSTLELEELKEKGFSASIYAAEEWDGFHGLEAYINETKI